MKYCSTPYDRLLRGPLIWISVSCLLSSLTCATAQPSLSHAAMPDEARESLAAITEQQLNAHAPDADPTLNEDDTPADSMSDEAAAGFLLERAFTHFRQGNHRKAARNFQNAIHTGQLNDAGRALAYWHIYLALRSEGDIDGSADALASFAVVAEDILGTRDNVRYAIGDSGDFVERFDLVRRIARARGMLSAIWAGKSHGFGRSHGNPVPITDITEITYFLEAAPPCADAADRQIWPTLAATLPPLAELVEQAQDAGNLTTPPIQKIQLRCAAGGKTVDYYFHVISQRDVPAPSSAMDDPQ